MRKLWVGALLLAGCGPLQLAGNWRVIQGLGNGLSSTCSMGLSQTGTAVNGAYACSATEGTVAGTLVDDDVSMTWSTPGYRPTLLVGKVGPDGERMSGTTRGSGYDGQAFRAERL